MSYFPFFVDIGQKPCLVAGGGMVALRKIEKLLSFGAKITVVSPVFCAEIEEIKDIHCIQRRFEAKDVEGMLFVIGATNDEAVNQEISDLCREKKIPVNIVDDPKKCTFFFPALVKRGELVTGISTGGGSPLAAQYIRKRVEEVIPADFDRMIVIMAEVRERLKKEIPDMQKREKILREVFALVLVKEEGIAKEEIERLLEEKKHDG